MFYQDIINIESGHSYGDVADPMCAPEDPEHPTNLERHNLCDLLGIDEVLDEEFTTNWLLFQEYFPDWLRWPMNPKDELTWSMIRREPDPEDRRLAYGRYVKELEIAIHEGHERILIQPRYIGEYASDFIRIGEHCHYYALFYGIVGTLAALRWKYAYWFYIPITYVSLINAYCYSRYWRCDRFYRYRIFEPELFEQGDMMPIVKNVEALRIWPKHYWILKRVGRVKTSVNYIRNQTAACCLGLVCAIRMGQIEKYMWGEFYRPVKQLFDPYYTCEYFLPGYLNLEKYYIPKMPYEVSRYEWFSWLSFTTDQWVAAILLTYFTIDFYRGLKETYWPKIDENSKRGGDVDFGKKVLPRNVWFDLSG